MTSVRVDLSRPGILLIAALFWSAAAMPSFAQSATGTLAMVVTDQAGPALGDVAIVVINTATGERRTGMTDARGRFAAPGLPIGPYEVTATLAGYAVRRQESLRLHVDETISLRLELEMTALADTLTVGGTPPTVESTRAHLSSIVDDVAIANLPVNGRNVLDLALVTPGTTHDPTNGGVSVGGQASTLNRLLIDGVDGDAAPFQPGVQTVGPHGIPFGISQEAVQELHVNANAYTAEYGRAGAAVLSVATKSGSNRVSGSLFEFHRNRGLRDSTAIDEGLDRPEGSYRANQFGGVFGGPIAKNRHFFLASYEGLRARDTHNAFLNLPAAIPNDALTGAALQRLQPLTGNSPADQTQDLFLVRTDHQMAAGQRLTLRYQQQQFDGAGAQRLDPQRARGPLGTLQTSAHRVSGTMASVLQPALLNEVRGQWARNRSSERTGTAGPQADVRQGGTLVLRIGGDAFSPGDTTLNRKQAADTLTWVHGAHQLKAGVDVQFDDIADTFPTNVGGAYVFQTLASFARGIPAGAGDSYTQAFARGNETSATTHPDVREYSTFVQNEWRPSDALTVNAGVRYDVQRRASAPVRNADPQLAAAGIDTSALQTDMNNVGPRVGVAWSPGRRRYVARAAYAMLYGRTAPALFGAAQANNGVDVQTITFRGDRGDPVPTYPGVFGSVPRGSLARPTIVVFDSGYQNPRTQQASGGVDWEWMPHTSISLNYLYVRGDRLPRAAEMNVGATVPLTLVADGKALPYLAVAPGPFTNFGRIVSLESSGASQYNGVMFELNHRFSQGYQYRLAYTLSKADDSGADVTSFVPDGADDRRVGLAASTGADDTTPADSDQRHRLVASLVYTTDVFADRFYGGRFKRLLRHWIVSAIYTIESGQPYSAYTNADLNRDGNRFNDIAPGTTRNQFRLPARISLDPRITRRLPLGRDKELQLIWEAFNLRNRPNYTAADNVLYTATGTTLARNAKFGRPVAQADPRVMQLAVRLVF